ncbi:MAG: Grx4 family monothiol glutaredoxin [Alphaproteobacteria bacterium]|nr:Grx4 family monothiol glutaredoxin [Alphaproteobacteria bacterium]
MTENNPIFDQIRSDIDSNDVVLFMKGVKQQPACGFSHTVVQILRAVGVQDFKDVNILLDPDLRQGVKDFTDWPTFPQLYVKGEFIGGCDIVREMYESGELTELLKEKGVALNAAA